ncbi:MAG TPA: hypothetical protein VGF31_05120 [Myxococcaceae bacterium]
MIASRTPGAHPGLRGLARWIGLATLVLSGSAFASEAELQLPDLSKVTFLGGTNGRSLLMWGLLICLFGFGFGVYQFSQLRKLQLRLAGERRTGQDQRGQPDPPGQATKTRVSPGGA